MKRVLKNKRGVAMESAILFMFVVLMLGMALTSVISITHLQVKVNDTLLQREVAIEQIGENFVASNNETDFQASITKILEDYTFIISSTFNQDNSKELTVTTKNGSHLLTVTVNNESTVTRWCYTTE